MLKERILAVYYDFHWLEVATKLLTTKLHSLYLKYIVGVRNFVKVRHFTSDSTTLLCQSDPLMTRGVISRNASAAKTQTTAEVCLILKDIAAEFVLHPGSRTCEDQDAGAGSDGRSCLWVTASTKQLKYLLLDKAKSCKKCSSDKEYDCESKSISNKNKNVCRKQRELKQFTEQLKDFLQYKFAQSCREHKKYKLRHNCESKRASQIRIKTLKKYTTPQIKNYETHKKQTIFQTWLASKSEFKDLWRYHDICIKIKSRCDYWN